ncbi:MAG: hypothetical protein AAGB19_08875 [Cyanobacteria bacterium P01_F01_bin.3]
MSCAHVLTGSAQWQGIVDEDAVGIDGERRGIDDRPVSRENEPFSQTAIGFVLGQTADVFASGEQAYFTAEMPQTLGGFKTKMAILFLGSMLAILMSLLNCLTERFGRCSPILVTLGLRRQNLTWIFRWRF